MKGLSKYALLLFALLTGVSGFCQSKSGTNSSTFKIGHHAIFLYVSKNDSGAKMTDTLTSDELADGYLTLPQKYAGWKIVLWATPCSVNGISILKDINGDRISNYRTTFFKGEYFVIEDVYAQKPDGSEVRVRGKNIFVK